MFSRFTQRPIRVVSSAASSGSCSPFRSSVKVCSPQNTSFQFQHPQSRSLSVATWRTKLAVRQSSKNTEGSQFRESSGTEQQRVHRVTNLSAGPSAINENVLLVAQKNFVNHEGSGMGMMEMSHRDAGGPVQTSMTNATNSIRDLLNVPDNYHVLWMAGGAHAQFAATIQNLMGDKNQVDVIQSGFWANRFLNTEARRRCDVNIAWSGENFGFRTLADASQWRYSKDSAFIHMCMNETIDGCEYLEDPILPDDAPIVACDATSTLLSRHVDISKYGIVYASSGKNLGPAGVTCVIVREDLLGRASDECPSVLNYSEFAHTSPIPSLFNTPPTYIIHMVSQVLEHYKQQGGLDTITEDAKFKADLMYDIIDQSDGFYTNHVNPKYRSRMTVPFRIMDGNHPELEANFIKHGMSLGIEQLFAHPLFPGLRVTMYNQLPIESVFKVAEAMTSFQKRYQVQPHSTTNRFISH